MIRTQPPSACAVASPSRDYVSFSSISLYRSCPLRYHFKYDLGLPEEIGRAHV